ncbi:MAG: hypothetical protein LBS19_13490 [Clostridiales bacterium]|nr:hypothetical protein [Clostridiales bacterium]
MTERIPVKVELRNSERMAVTGSLTRDDRVIVQANKPVGKGEKVRLETG